MVLILAPNEKKDIGACGVNGPAVQLSVSNREGRISLSYLLDGLVRGIGVQVFGVNELKVFTYSEARQNLSKLLILAQQEEVEIRRKDGSVFSLRFKKEGKSKSPFDVPGVSTSATTDDILEAVRESRATR